VRVLRTGKRVRDMHMSRSYAAENGAFGSHNYEEFMQALRTTEGRPTRHEMVKQRIRKYNVSRPHDCGHPMTRSEALDTVGRILDAEQVPRCPVGFSRNNRATAGMLRYKMRRYPDGRIELHTARLQFAENMLCGCLVAHEVAHLLEHVRYSGKPWNMGHGPEWRAIYVELLRAYFPAVDADKLAEAFREEFECTQKI